MEHCVDDRRHSSAYNDIPVIEACISARTFPALSNGPIADSGRLKAAGTYASLYTPSTGSTPRQITAVLRRQ